MDSLLTAAARALAAGDPLGALKRVALRDDPPALALRGTAMAQLGDMTRADDLFARAARAFGPRESVARARCVVARAEVALASRELVSPGADRALDSAIRTLESRGDRANALHARLVAARRQLLLGRLDAAERALAGLDLAGASPMVGAIHDLVLADVALRRVRAGFARAALERAGRAAARAGIPALSAEIEQALAALDAPAARLIASGRDRTLALADVESVLASGDLVVDACRRVVRDGRASVVLATRPVLFSLARALAEAWPGDVPRDALVRGTFGAARPNESHRARLRVEIGRLRRQLVGVAAVRATDSGFQIVPRARAVVVLAPPIDDEGAEVLALLGDGEAWSTSALALALAHSQRTVQRTLSALEAARKVRSIGRARARRWLAPPAVGFTTALLLPASLSLG